MQKHSLNKKSWSDLVRVLREYDVPITGLYPDRKLRWLLLAIACGVQLAMRMTPREWLEIDVRPGNAGTAGEVDIRFSVALPDTDDSEVLRAPARIFFQQPDLTELFYVFVGQEWTVGSFQSMAHSPEYTASEIARQVAAMFNAFYFDWWLVEQLGYEEAILGEW